MIVPCNRLLFLVGATTLPMSVVAAAVPAVLPLLLGTFAVITLISLLDALHAGRTIRGLHVKFPEKVNLLRKHDEFLNFTVYHDRPFGTLHVGLALPREVQSTLRELVVALPPEGEGLPIAWPVNAKTRGEYVLSRFYFRVPSRLGLWMKQGSLPAGTRILVYPDLLSEHRRVWALFPRRGGAGIHVHRQRGQGKEFEKLRDYLPGDSMSDVHWRMTAKRNRLVTKEYQLERTQEIYVVIDASRLSARPAGPDEAEPLLERYIGSALILGDFAQRQGDRFGLLTFSNRMLTFIRAAGGKVHFRACRHALLNLHPQPVTPDFEELAGTILQNLRRRALLLFLTSLDDPSLADSFMSDMEAVARRHIILVNMIRHSSARPLFSDGEVAGDRDIYSRLGGHLVWNNLRQLEVLLRRRGMGFALADRENLGVEMIDRYVDIKRRQVL